MKNLFFQLIFITVLGLSSCSSFNIQEDSTFNKETEQDDYLVYQIIEHLKHKPLILYNPSDNTHTEILPDLDINEFFLSTDNRLAFSTSNDGNSKIYVSDYPFAKNDPVEIIVDKSTKNIPLSWSPDRRFLLFYSIQADGKILWLWDGKNTHDIYEYRGTIDEIAWGPNGYLAFVEFYAFDLGTTHDWGSSEVFIWDGDKIVSASQNPFGEDRFPQWSKDGKLAFLSFRDGEYTIFVWDGISKINGTPDVDTFTKVASNLPHFSSPIWTSSDTLAFNKAEAQDLYTQIYEWDGQSSVNISKNPSTFNVFQSWRNDGYWAFSTFSLEVYVRDETNHTILITEGQQPAWSQTGLLVFCVNDSPNWILSIWNGINVVEIARGNFYITAKWNNGESISCSNG